MLWAPMLAAFAACLLGSAPGTSHPGAIAIQPYGEVEVIDTRFERSPDEKVPDLMAAARGLIDGANAFRVREDRARLVENTRLTEAASYFARYMAWTDRFGHTADGYDPGIRAKAHGYEFGLLSENIGYSFNTFGFTIAGLAGLFDGGWQGSPGHRANMLDPDVTEIGAAVARSEKTGYYYAVQLFGRPSSQSVVVEVANHTGATLSYRFDGRPFTLPPVDGRIHEQGRSAELIIELTVDGKPSPRTFMVEGRCRIVVDEDNGTVRIRKE